MKEHAFCASSFYYKDTGGKNPIVFMHNGGNDHTIWAKQAEAFEKAHRLLLVDLPGYGRSEKAKIPYRLSYYTDAIIDLCQSRIDGPALLAGNCMGSAIALSVAQKRPDLVRGLVLFNVLTRATLMAGSYGPVSRVAGLWGVRDFFAWMGDWYRPPRFLAKRGIMGQFGPGFEPDKAFVEHLAGLFRAQGQLRVLHSLIEDMSGFAAFDNWEKPSGFAPVLLFWGEKNKVLPWKAGRVFAQNFKPDRLVILKGAGHLCMVEQAQEANRQIGSFLDTLP